MQNFQSSIDLYFALLREAESEGNNPEKDDVKRILESMKGELIVRGNSPLLDLCLHECEIFCEENNISFQKNERLKFLEIQEIESPKKISVCSARAMILFLALYISGSSLDETLDRYFTGIFTDYTVEDKSDLNMERISFEVSKIDEEIQAQREKKHEEIISPSDSKAEEIVSQAEAEAEAEEIVGQAEAEAEKPVSQAKAEAEEIVSQAKAEAEEIVSQAKSEAEEIISRATQNARDIRTRAYDEAERESARGRKEYIDSETEKHNQEYESSKQKLKQEFDLVKNSLLQANTVMKQLEEAAHETDSMKAFNSLSELFNLVADLRESEFKISQQKEDEDIRRTVANLDEILSMITIILSDYGINAIISSPGDSYSPKYHAVKNAGLNFNGATVKKSVRTGFAFGNQVLQKEQIEILIND